MVITIVLLLGYVAFYFLFLDLFVDFWWFKSLKFENYFWLRTFYRYFFSIGVTVFFFGVFFIHFWMASRYLGIDAEEEAVLDSSQRKRLNQIVRWFRTGSLALFTPISLIMAFIIAIPFYEHWEYATLFFFGSASGIVDPVFGNDTSFYMFSYPMFTLVQQELLLVSFFILLLVSLQYWLAHHYIPAQKKNYPVGVKLHISLLLVFLVIHSVWGWLLERFSLLYVDDHLPEFFGPGFVELRYQLPLIWLKIITFICLVALVATYFSSKSKRSVFPMTLCVLFFAVLVGLQLWPVIPDFVSKYFVKPNPVSMERAFMENNIEATLA
ncbi:MAG: COG1615 family transporter, partial [Methylococcales bacterium]|nr:COG1615 family transporter [Methylococcales bacterium]